MKKTLLLFICALFFQCNLISNKPKNLIPQNQIENIIFDILVLNAIKSNGTISNQSVLLIGDQFIYQKYNVDSVQLAESYKYYMNDFNEYTEMYRRVQRRLIEVKDTINKTNNLKKAVQE